MLKKVSRPTKSLFILTLLCVLLFGVRFIETGEHFGFAMLWNLFLAWMPLFFALVSRRLERNKLSKYVSMGAWLLFFPNAPYVITDLIHLDHLPAHLWWYDSMGIFILAFTGLLLGIYSLSIVHKIWRKDHGSFFAWHFIIASMTLCGFGIYLGRFVRLNSWDIATSPLNVLKQIQLAMQNPLAMQTTLLFGVVLTTIYVAYYLLIPTSDELQKAN
jgi:uncharacterized membrane protein